MQFLAHAGIAHVAQGRGYGQHVASIERYGHRVAGRHVQRRRGGIALGHQQDPLGTSADQMEVALLDHACRPVLLGRLASCGRQLRAAQYLQAMHLTVDVQQRDPDAVADSSSKVMHLSWAMRELLAEAHA